MPLTPQQASQISQQIAQITAQVAKIQAGVQALTQAKAAGQAAAFVAPKTPAPVSTSASPPTPTFTSITLSPEKQQQAQIIAQQIQQIQSQIQKYQSALAAAREKGITTGPIPPEILEKYQITWPPTPPDTKVADQLSDSIETYLKWWKTEQQRLTKLQEAAEKEKKTWFEKMKETILARPKYEELLEEERKKWKVPEFFEKLTALMPEIETLRTRMVQEEARFQRGMAQIEQQPMAMPLILGEQAALQRQWAIEKSALAAELGVKLATAEMYRGNIDLANRLISQTIEAQMYDINQKIKDYQFFFEYYDDYYRTLDTKTQNAIQNQYNLLLKMADLKKEDLILKYDLMKDLATAGVTTLPTAEEMKTKTYGQLLETYGPKLAEIKAGPEWELREIGGTLYRVDPRTGKVEALIKAPTESLGFLEFTDQEKRKLLAAGIDWTTPEGYERALDFLYSGMRDYTDEEIRSFIYQLQPLYTPDQIRSFIQTSQEIRNKDRALFIANEILR